MQNFLYKKETFIYEKNNSITDELCKDIIEIFENDVSNNNCMDYNDEYIKIKRYLTEELKKNIQSYEKKINGVSGIEDYKIIDVKNYNFVFFIENNNKPNDIINYINRTTSKNNVKLLMYIWFLNDYDGEIIFWNEYKIIPKAGNFIIFPVSWCFPYQELIHLQTQKYIIYGYVYR
jgi:hypothetical protein